MLHIIENNGLRRTIIATVATFAEGLNKIDEMKPAFVEKDSHYIDCADAYLRDGRVIALQPVGFDVNDSKYWTYEKRRANLIRWEGSSEGKQARKNQNESALESHNHFNGVKYQA